MQELTDIEFLRFLERRGVEIRANEDRLRINAPAAALDNAIQAELVRRKSNLLLLLKASPAFAGRDRVKRVPLSYGQRGIWMVERFSPGTAAYSIPQAIAFDAPIDPALLQQSINRLLDRHEILRSYVVNEGDGVLSIDPDIKVPVQFTDLSGLEGRTRKDRLEELLRQESRRPFVLNEPPLFRCHLIRLGETEHILHYNVHHVLADEWSLGILRRDLQEFYAAAAAERDPDLPKLTMQYAEHSRWEQEQVRRAQHAQLDYWRTKLAGAPFRLELPFHKQRPLQQSFAGQVEPYSISPDLAGRLRQIAKSQNASMFMLLMAAFAVLLHRYTGKQDFCIGSPITGRTRIETEQLIGLFINMLVFRCRPQPEMSFRDCLHQVRATSLEAYSNGDLPFQRLVAELHPQRDPSGQPIFQVVFTLHTAAQPGTDRMRLLEIEPGISKFDIMLQLTESGNEIHGVIEYRTDLFDREDIQQLSRSLTVLLEEIARKPDRPISGLSLLTPEERERILVDWNATQTEAHEFATVSEWFRAQAARNPGATAVVAGDQALTYAELDRRSDLLAKRLRLHGVRRETVVGLYVGRNPRMVIGLLAILKAGGAYLPLDPFFPAERIEFLLQDAGVPLVLTEPSLEEVLPQDALRKTNAKVLAIAETWEDDGSPEAAPPDEEPSASDLAYLVYTSGSTGKPKGAEITQRALVNLLASMLREPGLGKDDVLVAVASLSFDLATLEIFGPLVSGARLVLAGKEQAADPRALAELLRTSGCTVFQATPTTWRMLVESGWSGKSDLRMWSGGETMPPDLAESLLARGREYWNLYGPTETTIYSSGERVESVNGPLSIGRPFMNTQIYILDEHLQPLPPGVDGELYIAGDGVARGYWKRPELTASRFVPNPFSRDSSNRMYRTGDFGRYRRDGVIQILGRTDHQIKLRGYRIELGEIESCLLKHPQVADALVFVHNADGRGPMLAAFVSSKQGATIDIASLIALQKSTLPPYMVVNQILIQQRFLLTPNGKTDRKAMIESFERRPKTLPDTPAVRPDVLQEPRDATEQVLIEIWQEAFEKAPIGIDEDFFALGGHSLLAVRLFSEIEKRLGKVVMLSVLFQAPTIRELATVVRG